MNGYCLLVDRQLFTFKNPTRQVIIHHLLPGVSTKNAEIEAVSNEAMKDGQGTTFRELHPAVFTYKGKKCFHQNLPSQ